MNWAENLQKIRDAKKKILVVGMGISGIETARFLLSAGITPVCVEKQDQQTFRAKSHFVNEIEHLIAQGVEVHFGIDGEKVSSFLPDIEIAVVSPGVSLETSIAGAVERNGIPVMSELELGVQVHRGPSVVVTGSIGKSTTTALIDHLLRTAGRRSILSGNSGRPVIAAAHLKNAFEGKNSELQPVFAVEASSYQLEACSMLKPAIAVFLNLAENHLERYGSMERYGAVKARVFKNQDSSDMLIACSDDKRVLELAKSGRGKLAVFGTASLHELTKLAPWAATVKTEPRDANVIELSLDGQVETYETGGALLLGRHNRLNMAAALLVCRRLGVPQSGLEKALQSFAPLEHRIENVDLPNGFSAINDSKATTVAASVAAVTSVLESFLDKNITLLIGGLSKAGSWAPLFQVISKNKNRIKRVFCFGKDGPMISRLAKSQTIEIEVAEKMEDAVIKGCADLTADEILLLSPGCVSFDEFSDFEQRGKVFKELVRSCIVKS